jgi:GTP-binding protein
MPLKIAIIGRPNVGKSTIFNRLTGTKEALVHDKPGLTRDRKEGKANISDLHFIITDTAGLEKAENNSIEQLMMEQTSKAIEDADIILFTIDGRAGVTNMDEYFARIVRRNSKPTIMLVNKAENERRAPGIDESYRLGFGDPVVLSAEHGIGFGDLYDAIIEKTEKYKLNEKGIGEDDEKPDLMLAIFGRPNVGKSTLFNAILGEHRSITSDIAGTTRDSIYVDFHYKNTLIKLVDTAGIRKKHRSGDFLEELSVNDSLKSLKYANVAVLVIDAKQGIDKMDLKLADEILYEGKALVLVLNKWDSLTHKERETINYNLETMTDYSLSQAKTCPVIRASALKEVKISDILDAAIKVYGAWNTKISTSKLNEWLHDAVETTPPPTSKTGKRVKLKYITQVTTRPPMFKIFTTSNLKGFPESYVNYLRNSMRKAFGIKGTPIRISIKKTGNPYAGQEESGEES